ncbi:MAG: transcription-repair coupling factor [Oscillospiraceae bacterium]|nr:transcription-repair coupling factor [Oscillospiraceae bacterium]
MKNITQEIRRQREYSQLAEYIQTRQAKPKPALVTGLCPGAEFALCAELFQDIAASGRQALVLLSDERMVRRWAEQLQAFGIAAMPYLWRDFNFHPMTASREMEHERLSVLSALLADQCDVVLTTPDAALQYTMPPGVLEGGTLEITKSTAIQPEELTAYLDVHGYRRGEVTDGVGQYSLRGGIVDVFAPGQEQPVRLDFWGDSIERIRSYDPITQRQSDADLPSFRIIPAREVAAGGEQLTALEQDIRTHIKSAKNDTPSLAEEAERLSAGIDLPCLDKYISHIYPQRQCLLDYLDNPVILALELNAVLERQRTADWQLQESILALLEGGALLPKYADYSKNITDLEQVLFSSCALLTSTFTPSFSERQLAGIYSFNTKQTVATDGNFEVLSSDIADYVSTGYRVKLLCENVVQAETMGEMLREAGISTFMDNGEEQPVGTVALSHEANLVGFELVAAKYAVLSIGRGEMGARRKPRSRKSAKKDKNLARIMSYADLVEGDYVVHTIHGIGQYLGLGSLEVEGIRRDFVKIKYAGTDMLYLPCNQLEKVSKYIGPRAEEGTLRLSKMGGTEWAKTTTKAKNAAKAMAKELIALYAERMQRPGYAFPKDDEMQAGFESTFEFEPTEGQVAAIEDVKSDMQKRHPMDRLLCGDVGYGKTEVALRAAFKAACDGKQVAILVPTTILAMQHYRTFLSRMRSFPVKVDMVSRFRTTKEIGEVLRRLKRGETDIIVGTHRLLSADVQFKDIGLLIVDEEQRFGVSHKEKLKQLGKNIDVLTLTATPIPRTLNMALGGIRDMSLLEEAPGERVPIQSYVLEHDDAIIAEAIRRELRRGGQVFYLCNRIERMDAIVTKLAGIAPEAAIETAHGKMDKDTLSDIWEAMVDGQIQILVSTTIIETGIDIPNANTLIIEDADKFGLSQLHQIRGRVGRSSRRAYAYFTYQRGKLLSEISTKRLTAIRDFTEFGSGFRIALRDLEIRGAGNLLGGEQHGHIESIGYDMYMKILSEAVLEERGETAEIKTECTVELGINAFIPESYISNGRQRIEVYKKIAMIETPLDLEDVREELIDRYGAPPPEAECILAISLLRTKGADNRIKSIEGREGSVLFYPEKVDLYRWTKVAAQYNGKLLLNLGNKPYAALKLARGGKVAEQALAVLGAYESAVENAE